MATHHVEPTRYYTAIGRHRPALRVTPGDTILTTTVDARGADHSGASITPGGNPQTGPFYVDGARPGDTLVIHIERLTPNRASGFSRTVISPQVLTRAMARRLPRDADAFAQWSIDAEHNAVTLLKPDTALERLALPLSPMLGCFGVAPTRREALAATANLVRRGRWPRGFFAGRGYAISTATAGRYGGNMDYSGFTAGVTVYLPVFAPGALFFLGDGHARQGAGEIIGTGIETSFEAQFVLDLQPGRRIGWPRGETREAIFTVGNAYPLGLALRYATTEMYSWLRDEYRLDDQSIGLLLGACVEYDVGNVYDPAYTMVCRLAKAHLSASA